MIKKKFKDLQPRDIFRYSSPDNSWTCIATVSDLIHGGFTYYDLVFSDGSSYDNFDIDHITYNETVFSFVEFICIGTWNPRDALEHVRKLHPEEFV